MHANYASNNRKRDNVKIAEDILFGLLSASNTLTKKLNYTLLFLCYLYV